ncbi:hypothetical protein V494_01458 [Pseudogymnoascus sp. VKM F-4513 (FW-928)]|nr:hypothetical protein V494_01458 [Pseudogymnoascus sp. VKM F-4513 (FW-928)]
MHYLALAALLTAVMATPADNAAQARLCPIGLYSIPLCCATDVGGLACLDATTPRGHPDTVREFRDACADVGQQARCCVVPVLGQALLCTPPI